MHAVAGNGPPTSQHLNVYHACSQGFTLFYHQGTDPCHVATSADGYFGRLERQLCGLSLGQVTTGEIGAEFEGDAFDLSVESDAIFSGFYGVVGVSRGSATLASGVDLSADGINIGIGADYMVSDQFMIGAEFLARRMNEDDFAVTGINVDTTADTLAIRAAYKF